MDPAFLTTGFPKRFSCRDIVDPTAQRKNSLMRSACAWCVCARYQYIVIARVQSCSHALLRLVSIGRLASATAPARNGPRSRRAGGATLGPAHAPGRFAKAGHAGARLAYAGYGQSPRQVDLPGFEQ